MKERPDAPQRPVSRRGPPPPGPQRPFRFPEFERRRLANGLAVYAAPVGHLPLVELELLLPGGAEHDPPERAGLATLTAALLNDGSREHTALELAAAAERLGGSLDSQADWDAASIGSGLLAEHLESGLGLLAEVATRPAFPARELERRRQRRLAELLRQRAQPQSLATAALTRALYAPTVYGNTLDGRAAGLRAITRDEVEVFAGHHLTPAGGALLAVGAFEPERLFGLAADHLGDWRARPASPSPDVSAPEVVRPDIVPPEHAGPRIELVNQPRAVQTELRVGLPTVSRRHPDWVALHVLNCVLGGKFTSRLNLSLRERLGVTYGAHSSLAARLGPGPLVIATAVATDAVGAAVGEAVTELGRLRSRKVGDDELEEAHSYLIGAFPYPLQRLGGVLHRLAELALYGLPDDYFRSHAERLRAVDGEALRAVAGRYLDPRRIAVVAVGPASRLAPQLEAFGEVSIRSPKEVIE